MSRYDSVVVGAGPNGLAAAITLAQSGQSVLLIEANEVVGGGVRTAEITLPGFAHDLGSAIHPFAAASTFLRSLPLDQHGLTWIQPPIPLVHPFDDGTAATLHRSLPHTAASLAIDAAAYRWLLGPVVANWDNIAQMVLGPPHSPRNPVTLARFGARSAWPASLLAQTIFRTEQARALFAGLCAHSGMPLEQPPTAGIGVVLATLAHLVGWPFPQGGAGSLTRAMASYFRSLGGQIITGQRVENLDDLPECASIVCDVTPMQLLRMSGSRLSPRYRRALQNFKMSQGVFKIDWALDAPIPWTATACTQTATLHLGGGLSEMCRAERAPWRQQCSDRPFVILAQPSLFDSTRAPAGQHTAWAYCHVPRGSTVNMTSTIEAQVERFAPGFQSHILARSESAPADLEASNANLIGGDISGGMTNLRQVITRPTISLSPYSTSAPNVFLCSSSTPPGAGVHGLCGYHAARAVLRAQR